ncbi:hypothetical protein BJI49_09770 [Acetobacter pasteurianus]|nr:hypothetical protein BJI49_09770 [Acetobacter pasteurianus]GCD50139.1 hypothetical protein NBRC106471_1695 [Acetobacter pasteurianus subsp. pasteurianus LMG 1262 = NBRC 106471]
MGEIMIIHAINLWLIFGISQVFSMLLYDRIYSLKDVAEIILAISAGPLLFPLRFLLSAYSRHRQRKILEFYRNQQGPESR